MSDNTKEAIEQLISYYGHHSIEEFVKGEERLQNFAIDDFTKLLALLEKELSNA